MDINIFLSKNSHYRLFIQALIQTSVTVSQILDAGQYEYLLRQGLDFFGARFHAIAERWWRNGGAPQSPFAGFNQVSNQIIELVPGQHQQQPPTAPSQQQQHHHQQQQQQQQDDVLQCYRCQGFWHVAANCRQLPRCVRCGEPHSVEFCSRPRNNPVCCHCSGPHHAGIWRNLSENSINASTKVGKNFFQGTLSGPGFVYSLYYIIEENNHV